VLAGIQASPLRRLELLRRWADGARANYAEAARLAGEGR